MTSSVIGIGGMIVTSIADSTGGALAFGLLTAAGAGALVVANFVAGGGAAAMAEEALVSRLESDVAAAERAGHNSAKLRRLSRDAFELGRRNHEA